MKTKEKAKSKKKAFTSEFTAKIEKEKERHRRLVKNMEKMLWVFSMVVGLMTFFSLSAYIYLNSSAKMIQEASPSNEMNIMIDSDTQQETRGKAAPFNFSDSE